MTGEKTEKPTPHRRKQNRKEGQVPRTQEIGAWASMMLITLALPALLTRQLESFSEFFQACLRALEDPTPAVALQLLGRSGLEIAIPVVVLGLMVMIVSVAATMAQGGFYLATKAVKPSLKKLDPIKGAKRIFGPQALWEGAKMLIKCALVAVLVYYAVRAQMPLIGGMVPMGAVLEIVNEHAMSLLRNVALAGFLMGLADYAMQRRRVGKQTRMSKDEVKQEHKQQEGDPLVKSAIRGRQLAAARNRMMADVPEADVVLVNPTHVAVALRYQPEKGAPVVVARGAGAIATRIREKATEAGVPLVQDVPLARALYTASEVGHPIPAELFAAVAHVLAFVISRRTRGATGGTHASPRPTTEVPYAPHVRRRRRATTPDTAATTRPAGAPVSSGRHALGR